MSNRRNARTDAGFCVYYEVEPGSLIQQKHRTKEDNDNFAASLPLMGIDEVTVNKMVLSVGPAGWMRYD